MRNRILAGLGVAALASVGIATPATAVTPTTADLYIVHAFPATAGIPDTTVDISIADGAISLPDVPEGVAAGPGLAAPGVAVAALGNLAPNTYNVEIRLSSAAPGDPALFDAPVTLAAGKSYTAVAHPAVGGAFTVSVFENDLTAAAGNGIFTVRHTADVGPVNVYSGTTQLAGPIANAAGEREALLEVPAGDYTALNAGPSAPGPINLGNVTLPAATNIFVHAYGPDTDGGFDAVIFAIGGLTTPAGVPAGSAGLVAEGAPVDGVAIGGVAALMLALMAAVAVIVRRRAVSVER